VDRRQEIGDGLAGARAGLHQQVRRRVKGLGHGLKHGHLLGPVLIAWKGRLKDPIRGDGGRQRGSIDRRDRLRGLQGRQPLLTPPLAAILGGEFSLRWPPQGRRVVAPPLRSQVTEEAAQRPVALLGELGDLLKGGGIPAVGPVHEG